MEEKKAGLKLIYKKTLAMELVRCGHDLEYTARNWNNDRYQIYFFRDCAELRKDIARINGQPYNAGFSHDSGFGS